MAQQFKARGIKVENNHPEKVVATRVPRTGPGFDLQNAYDSHLQRQASPTFGSSAPEPEVSTPFTRGVVNNHMAAIQAKTGQSANMFTVNPGDVSADGKSFTAQGQKNADDFHGREQLAEDTDETSFQSGLKSLGQVDETGSKTQALGHAMPHINPAQQDIYKQMASDPNVSAHDFYGHLIQATTPPKAAAAKAAVDPVEQYGKYGDILQKLQKEDASDPQVRDAIQDTHVAMNKLHAQIVPPPGAADAAAPASQAFAPAATPLGPAAQAATPNQPAAVQGGWNGHAEGTVLHSPSTGRQFKIVNGQPTEITNAAQ